jgi:hypothetical protein
LRRGPTRSDKFLEDWRHDIQNLRDVCDFTQTVVVANEICRICEKEYNRLVSFVLLTEWSQSYRAWMERLNAEFDKLSPADQSMGELEVILQRCRDGLPMRPTDARVRRRASTDRLHPPLEPYWTLPSDSETAENIVDDNEEFLLHYAALDKLSDRLRALNMQRAGGRTATPENTTQTARQAGIGPNSTSRAFGEWQT